MDVKTRQRRFVSGANLSVGLIGLVPHFDCPTVTCPCCGDHWVHVGSVEKEPGRDNYESSSGLRGDCVVICFSGECGSSFVLRLGEHKGNVQTSVEVLKDCRYPARI